MADLYANHAPGLDAPAQKAFAIIPHDSNDLALTTRAVYTGKGGTIVCILLEDSSEVTLSNVPSGIVLPLRIRRVLATGTTASMDLVGLT